MRTAVWSRCSNRISYFTNGCIILYFIIMYCCFLSMVIGNIAWSAESTSSIVSPFRREIRNDFSASCAAEGAKSIDTLYCRDSFLVSSCNVISAYSILFSAQAFDCSASTCLRINCLLSRI